jgi:CHASE2 domain-containing sensor protein
VFIAAFFAWTARRPRLAAAVGVVAAAFVALSVVQMWQYWHRIIPGEHTTWAQYRALFLRFP